MTSWRGFVKESKSYMNHPDYWMEAKAQLYYEDGTPDPNYPGWTEKDRFYAILNFWRKFPRAWFRFHWLVLRSWVKGTGPKERVVQGKSVLIYTKPFGRGIEVVMEEEDD